MSMVRRPAGRGRWASIAALAALLLTSAPAVRSQALPASPLAAALEILNAQPPEALERTLARDPRRVPATLAALAEALAVAEAPQAGALAHELAALSRARAARLAGQGGPWAASELADLLHLQLLDPRRFADDPAFRRRVLAYLPAALGPEAPPPFRERLLRLFNTFEGFDFEASDALEHAWGVTPRRSLERGPLPATTPWEFAADTEGALAASVYSLPAAFVTPEEAGALLGTVRALAPDRTLLVLTDLPLAPAAGAGARLRVLDTLGRAYTPWPRDPLSLVRAPQGRVAVLLRPNLQPGREEDASLGLELVQNLPADLDQAWGGVGWAEATTPFHNGQVLLSPDAAWVTLHSLEVRALELLGLERVPVASFGAPEGVARYLEAVRGAAAELERLYRRPVRFVHPLPGLGEGGGALMARLGGGAGFDLDSLLTLLPAPGGGLAALVADVEAGLELLTAAPSEEVAGLARAYGLAGDPGRLAPRLEAAQRSRRARALDEFLGLVAGHLAAEGVAVRRLPLLLVPTALLEGGEEAGYPEFLLGWNNVVVERRPEGTLRAEGFSSLLPSGDARARAVFRQAGVALDLLPPLVESVVRNGGYRCASNHLRER
jgi:hypothetical protein